jgi:hypothetical protein
MPFVSPYANLQVMLLNDRHPLPWIMTEKMVYECQLTGETHEVERHFRTDLASIPIAMAAIPVIGPMLVIRYFGRGVWMGARECALHDWLRTPDKYGNLPVPARVAHRIFRAALYEAGYPPDLCENYYSAVVAFNS